MRLKRAPAVGWSEVTPKAAYLCRRAFIRALIGTAVAAPCGLAAQDGRRLPAATSRFGAGEAQTPYSAVTSYNNFYEFGVDKDAPSQTSKRFKTDPWTIAIEGEVSRGGRY